jgi:hypothetical protein
MSPPKRAFNRADIMDYAEDMILDALRSAVVDPQTGLECFFFALQPELVRVMRELSRLEPERREYLLREIRQTKSNLPPSRSWSTSND